MARKTWLERNWLPVGVAAGAAVGAAVALWPRQQAAAAALPPGASPGAKNPPRPATPAASTRTPTVTTPSAPLSDFAARVASMSSSQYEAAVLAEVLAGHVPELFKTFVPVAVSLGGRSGTFWCTAVPLTVGPDAAPFHAPVSARLAQRVADHLGCFLPTRLMVDAIHAQANTRVPFQSVSADRGLPRTFATSSAAIEQRRAGRGGLVSDYAKDYVLSTQRRNRLDKIAIYGAWRSDGTLVQPLAVPHAIPYYDYSQQPRFIGATVSVDGRAMRLVDALADPSTAPLFSAEGVLTGDLLRY